MERIYRPTDLSQLVNLEPFREIVLVSERKNDFKDIALLLVDSDGKSYIYGISRQGKDSIIETIFDISIASCKNGKIMYVDEKYVGTLFRSPIKPEDCKFITYDKFLKKNEI